MINTTIEKSFNNIMYQQEKMDNKSYIFLGFLGFFLTSGYFETTFAELDEITVRLIYIIVIALIFSLIPIINKLIILILRITNVRYFKKNKGLKEINIFYYLDIYPLNREQFINTLKTAYKFDRKEDITKADEYLIDQIIINSRILRIKVFFHEMSQTSVLIILVRYIYYYFLSLC